MDVYGEENRMRLKLEITRRELVALARRGAGLPDRDPAALATATRRVTVLAKDALTRATLGDCGDAWRALGRPTNPGCDRLHHRQAEELGLAVLVEAALPDGSRALVCHGVLDALAEHGFAQEMARKTAEAAQ